MDFKSIAKIFPLLTLFVIITIIFATIYVGLQQQNRMSINFLPQQIAEDNAAYLEKDSPSALQTFAQQKQIDIGTSLSPFFVIYDLAGRPVAGSGYLDNALPQIPYGVLKSSTAKGQSSVTWQPKKALRFATVTVPTKNYFVLAGTSIREFEKNIENIGKIVAIGWILSLIGVAKLYWFTKISFKQKH